MVTQEQIKRINELAAKKKTQSLSPEELAEQAELRKIYIAAFRENLESQLKNIEFIDSDSPSNKNVKKH